MDIDGVFALRKMLAHDRHTALLKRNRPTGHPVIEVGSRLRPGQCADAITRALFMVFNDIVLVAGDIFAL